MKKIRFSAADRSLIISSCGQELWFIVTTFVHKLSYCVIFISGLRADKKPLLGEGVKIIISCRGILLLQLLRWSFHSFRSCPFQLEEGCLPASACRQWPLWPRLQGLDSASSDSIAPRIWLRKKIANFTAIYVPKRTYRWELCTFEPVLWNN